MSGARGITLKSKFFKVVKVNKKSKAELIRKIEAGDIIYFDMTIKYATGQRGSLAADINVRRSNGDRLTTKSQTNLINLFNDNIEIEPLFVDVENVIKGEEN